MRIAVLTLGFVAACLLAAWAVLGRRVDLPPIGPGVEQICAETMQRTAADLSWMAPNRKEKIRGREIKAVTLGQLPSLNGSLVRVAGVLHAEFEWVGLYPSRAAMEDQSWRGPWVTLGSLWPDEPYWKTKGPSISDRCVVVEGTYSGGAGGHMGMFNGTIGDVLRLEVWSTPHRPFVTTPPPPVPPPAPPYSEKPSTPKQLPNAAGGQEMLAEFNKLYETGEFQLGYCLAAVQVNAEGSADTVRVVRPQSPVPFAMSVGVGHCPSRPEASRKPER